MVQFACCFFCQMNSHHLGVYLAFWLFLVLNFLCPHNSYSLVTFLFPWSYTPGEVWEKCAYEENTEVVVV